MVPAGLSIKKANFFSRFLRGFSLGQVVIMSAESYDAIVIGSGPNGLAAAITLAQAGCSVLVCEAEEMIGGGTRSAELTLPGFVHDICSAVHPLAIASPFFRSLPLSRYGLKWICPPTPLAHPLEDGTAVCMESAIAATGANLGVDGENYQRLLKPFCSHWEALAEEILRPLRIPRHPMLMARFGFYALRSARNIILHQFTGGRARALWAGLAAHSMLPLDQAPSAAAGLALAASAHAVGWPFPQGGSQQIAAALSSYLFTLGGKITTGMRVTSVDDLPPSRAVLCGVTPRQLLRIAGHRLPAGYRRKLEKYRYGMAAFKVDYALDGPIPWKAPRCLQAGTIHLGGTWEEIAASERSAWEGAPPTRPFVLLSQPSLFDPTRAPAGQHTVWAYCHVPNGSRQDMREYIERQIERFAPGFRDRILAHHVLSPEGLESHNANLVGGDINGGVQDLRQFFTRPTWRLYATPARGLYLCSSSTPPGGGVHGMCGHFAALSALRHLARDSGTPRNPMSVA